MTVGNLESKRQQLFTLTADTDTWIINSIEFSPDGNFLVTGGGDGAVLYRVDIFESDGDRFRHVGVHEWRNGAPRGEAVQVAFSADSRLVGTVSQSGTARVWSLRGPKWEATLRRKNGLFSLAFSPDGRILALGDSSGIQLCDLKSQFPLATIPIGCSVRSLRFSPDGQTLAWASVDGRVEMLRTLPVGLADPMPSAKD